MVRGRHCAVKATFAHETCKLQNSTFYYFMQKLYVISIWHCKLGFLMYKEKKFDFQSMPKMFYALKKKNKNIYFTTN